MAVKGKIVVLGAGKSSSYLIKYLSYWSFENQIGLIIADAFPVALSNARTIVHPEAHCEFILLRETDVFSLEDAVMQGTVVISMLPVAHHYGVAQACLKYNKHLLTASYISPEMQALDKEVKQKGLTFLFECGLDPGLDHMSAFDLLDRIQNKEEEVISFISVTGGLVDPAYEGDNPWLYKFTWNPRNVVVAGKGTALFKENSLIKKISYKQLFATARPLIWKGKEELEFYPNRDSFKYQELYGLQMVQTFIRGTIRRKGYSEAWNVFVQLGMTDDEIILEDTTTYASFLAHFVPGNWTKQTLEAKLSIPISDPTWEKLIYLTLDSDIPLTNTRKTAAAYLQEILEVKWALQKEDKDWVLMQHRIKTVKRGVEKEYRSTLSVKGENSQFTAMAKTVGLPLAMAAVSVYENTWREAGIHLPSNQRLYLQILSQLKREGVSFEEEEL
ncbi:MAG: saccharopine dehydrogenase NADP-binding domain-containing protein [Cytophagaceae bacterium]|nr:saccharopine dehydrogenase NADP-binding domain-containing protein [Cytophagaceae bacterium]